MKIRHLLISSFLFSTASFAETAEITGPSALDLYDHLALKAHVIQPDKNRGINPHIGTKTFTASDDTLTIKCSISLYTKQCTFKSSKRGIGVQASKELFDVLSIKEDKTQPEDLPENLDRNGSLNPFKSSKTIENKNLMINCEKKSFSTHCSLAINL